MTVYEDEIDLRPYILTLIRNWWLVLLLAGLTGAAALVFSLMQPRSYEATATVLLTRTRAALALAQQFPTVNEPVDSGSRMAAMLSIAESDYLAADTFNALLDKLPSEARDFGTIANSVEVTNEGDVILFTASTGDPQLAAEIANTWAQRAVSAINQAYSGEQPLPEIQAQLQTARSEYQTAQAELQNFVKSNQIDLLAKRIEEGKTLFSRLADDRAHQINYFTDRKQAMHELSVQAEALHRQVSSGERSITGELGDALAVLKARATSLGTERESLSMRESFSMPSSPSADTPVNVPYADASVNLPASNGLVFNLQLTEIAGLLDTPANYAADLETLISIYQAEETLAEEALISLSQAVQGGQTDPELEALAAQIRDFEAQLEAERARERQLTSQRDISWEAYQALAQKEAELTNTPQTNNQVSLASPAVPPQQPASRGTLRNTLIAGTLGLILGILWIFGSEWWRMSGKESDAAGLAVPGEANAD